MWQSHYFCKLRRKGIKKKWNKQIKTTYKTKKYSFVVFSGFICINKKKVVPLHACSVIMHK